MSNLDRNKVLVAAALLTAVARPSLAQSPVFGMIGVGPAIPTGTFGEGFGTGFDILLGVGTRLKQAPVEVRVSLTLGSFSESGGLAGTTGKSRPRGLAGDLLYRLGKKDRKVSPYLVGGLGLSSVKYSSGYTVPGETGGGDEFSETDTGLSFGGGGGVTIDVGKAAIFGEARYTAIPKSDHSHLPIRVGVRLGRR